LDQAAGDGEPEPEAGLPLRRPGGVRLAEGVEDVGMEVGADALARVAHGDARQPVLAFQRYLDAAAPGRELERVAQEVPDDLLQPLGVAVDRPEDRKSTRLNSSHVSISYAVFCLKKKKQRCAK